MDQWIHDITEITRCGTQYRTDNLAQILEKMKEKAVAWMEET